MKVLLTGFEPFGGDTVNASWEAVRTLADAWDATAEGAELATALLPVTFASAAPACAEAVAQHHPDVLISVGLAGNTDRIRLERVAINVADARIPDNEGARPDDEPIATGGPAAHFTGLPIKAALAALTDAAIPAVISDTAGTFVCNKLFYLTRHRGAPATSGFVHVPRLAEEEYDDDQGLPLATTVEALRIIVRTSIAEATTRNGSVGSAN